MRTCTLILFAIIFGFTARAQTVATFDTLPLSKPDTFYVNYSSFGNDVGFNDGLVRFPCVYDSAFGFKFWSSGFAYSNMTDSLTPGFFNQYSAITGKGYNNSSQYLVSWGSGNKIYLTGKAKGQPVNGFYIANSTYAYMSMRDGDAFSKKFGGTSGNDSDWYKVTVRGYASGTMKVDSVEVFMGDYRDPNNANDTIYRGWRWVNLLPLGNVDSLRFDLSSSDTAGGFGMNTPAYFCMDNFSTYETASVGASPGNIVAKVYPNPAVNELFIESGGQVKEAFITDAVGKVIGRFAVQDGVTSLPISSLVPGTYTLYMRNGDKTASVRFVKQ